MAPAQGRRTAARPHWAGALGNQLESNGWEATGNQWIPGLNARLLHLLHLAG
jgi:hypothetical protein